MFVCLRCAFFCKIHSFYHLFSSIEIDSLPWEEFEGRLCGRSYLFYRLLCRVLKTWEQCLLYSLKKLYHLLRPCSLSDCKWDHASSCWLTSTWAFEEFKEVLFARSSSDWMHLIDVSKLICTISGSLLLCSVFLFTNLSFSANDFNDSNLLCF